MQENSEFQISLSSSFFASHGQNVIFLARQRGDQSNSNIWHAPIVINLQIIRQTARAKRAIWRCCQPAKSVMLERGKTCQTQAVRNITNMPQRFRTKLEVIILLALLPAIFGLGIVVEVLLAEGLGVDGLSSRLATATPNAALENARAVVAQLRQEVVPREGFVTAYGVSFSDDGFNTLIEWNRDRAVPARDAPAFESLDLRLPCCNYSQPSRDETKNCRCGHHFALEGLSKELLSRDWTRDQVQFEVMRWSRYFYPANALRAELEKRGQLDQFIQAALDELTARGEC